MNNSNIMLVPNFSEATSVVELHESKRAKINAPKKSKLELTYNAFLENMVPTQNEVSGNVSKDDNQLTKYDAFATTHNIEVIIGDYKEASNTGARKLRVAGVLPPKISEFAKEKTPVVEEKKEELEVPKSEPVETKIEPEVEVKEDIKIAPVEAPAKEEPLSRVKVHEDTYDISDDKGESAVAYSKQINLNNSNIDAYLKNAAMPNLDDPLYQKYGQELDSIMKQKQEYREKIAYLEEVKRNYDDEIAKAKKQKEIIEAEKAKEYEAKILQETQSLDGIVAQYQELKAAIEAQKVELATYKDE